MITMLLPCPNCRRTTKTLPYYGNDQAVCENCGHDVFETKPVAAGEVVKLEWPSESGERFYPRKVVVELEERLKKALEQKTL